MNRRPTFRPHLPFVLPLATLFTACAAPPILAPPQQLSAEALAARAGSPIDASLSLQTVAFGSCSNTELPQPLWAPISAANPDLWIWLGDNVYGDTNDMNVMRGKYEDALAVEGYASLLTETPVIGTWDDHDFGLNNAGSEYSARVESQQEMLDFLGEPMDSPRRQRAGVYTSYTYGEVPQKTKVILLDSRYHREEPGAGSTILGEQQWQWLEAELANSDAQIHLIGGGFQFLPEDHPYEKWANFPDEYARLFEVIGASGAPGVILLSGDRHISEIMRVENPALSYPLYEVTSSGMTHSWADNPGEVNRHRLGELYTDLGFGVMEIDWDTGTIKLQLRDGEGAVSVEEVVMLADLG